MYKVEYGRVMIAPTVTKCFQIDFSTLHGDFTFQQCNFDSYSTESDTSGLKSPPKSVEPKHFTGFVNVFECMKLSIRV